MEALVKLGARVEAADKYGETALMIAKSFGHETDAVVEWLEAHITQVEAANNRGETASMLAAESGEGAAVEALKAHGEDGEAADEGGTAASMAASGQVAPCTTFPSAEARDTASERRAPKKVAICSIL